MSGLPNLSHRKSKDEDADAEFKGDVHNSSSSKDPSHRQLPFIDHLFPMIFGCDLRSLAAYRVAVSILIILDLYVRSGYLHDHYTLYSVFPPHIAAENYYAYSIHFVNSTHFFQALLFMINAAVAFMMLIGFHTRIASILSWFLMLSLHNRNPLVLNGGDDFLRLFLFWAMFLPLGAKYSWDACHTTHPSHSKSFTTTWSKYYVSFASVAIMTQFSLVYWFTVALKDSVEWHTDYTAVYYALNLDQFATVYGKFLLGFPGICKFLTIATFYWEMLGPCCFFVPIKSLHGPFRTLGVIGFIALHFGFGMCLELGFFMYIPAVCALVFLPAWFWDNLFYYLFTKKQKKNEPRLEIQYNPYYKFLLRGLVLFRMFFLDHAIPIFPIGGEQGGIEMTEAGENAFIDENNETHNEEQVSRLESHKQNSWLVVIDHSTRGERLTGYDAFVRLIEASPLLWFFAPIYRLSFVNKSLTSIANFLPIIFSSYPQVLPKPASNPHAYTHPKRRWYIEIVVVLLLAFVVIWNFASFYHYGVSERIRWIAPTLKLDQWWGMFSPHPPKEDGWLVMPGNLHNGTQVNIFAGKGVSDGLGDPGGPGFTEVSYEKPALVSHQFAIQRWRKYLMNLESSSQQDKRLHYGRYLCREWNWWGRHPGGAQLKDFKIIFMVEKTPPPGEAPQKPFPIELWSHTC
eukprot:TRINITY_DN841_c0_g1_i14.p1 TRINITY_DN841_c0_g1~~TRINITY_DN841_c0_g1_i14.p1  ORF type:complete len:684 (+),score=98.01 TRINITY_DN841_c0_g1_i14:1092-3143(+)